jgi:hypothetical protein
MAGPVAIEYSTSDHGVYKPAEFAGFVAEQPLSMIGMFSGLGKNQLEFFTADR